MCPQKDRRVSASWGDRGYGRSTRRGHPKGGNRRHVIKSSCKGEKKHTGPFNTVKKKNAARTGHQIHKKRGSVTARFGCKTQEIPYERCWNSRKVGGGVEEIGGWKSATPDLYVNDA